MQIVDPAKRQLFEAAIRTCIEHGFDCLAFLELLRSSFGIELRRPEDITLPELTRFLLASREWAPPPRTDHVAEQILHAAHCWAMWRRL